MNKNLYQKLKESLSAVLPITGIVLVLHLTAAPLPQGLLPLFLLGALLLVAGMGLFTLGADMAMMPMGEGVGAQLTKWRRLGVLLPAVLALGVLVTVAEPDLSVLARQVPAVSDLTLILSVAVGVGLFLALAALRIVLQIKLSYLLMGLYAGVFLLAAFTQEAFLAVAFDSGGVTTGPITVPFILALGLGISAVGRGKGEEDSFGLVALCSIGPILAVLLLGMFHDPSALGHGATMVQSVSGAGEALRLLAQALPEYLRAVALALSPIVAFFLAFQLFFLRLPRARVIKLGVGLLYTYLGLVLFLTGVNVGFMPAGHALGAALASGRYAPLLIPLSMLIGFFIVAAEPAVHVLVKQVEEVSGGAIPRRALQLTLSLGVAVSVGLAMLRVLTGLSIWYILLPGYLLALGLAFVTPPIFTAIAFDSGGVASGPMTATFLLPFAMGACEAVGGNLLTDAFGVVAMVAMTPLVAIQLLGLIYRRRIRKEETAAAARESVIDL